MTRLETRAEPGARTRIPTRRRRPLQPRQVVTVVVATIILGWWAIVSIFPFYWNFVAALLPVERIFSYPPNLFPTDPTLRNFVELNEAIPTLPRNIANSLILALAIPTTNVIMSTLAGYAFAQLRFVGKEVIFYLIVFTMAVPSLTGFVPLYLQMTTLGLTDSLLAVFLPSLVGAFGVFLFRQTMETIPDELFDSARIDGATPFQIYRMIAVPLVMPMVITQFTIGFLNAFNDYFWPLVILRSPEQLTFPVALGSIQGQVFNSPWGVIMAGALILMVPALVVFATLSRYIVPNTTAGALKG